MKLAFMTFACPEWTVPEIIEGARRYSYDGVEIRVSSEHRHGLETSADATTRREAMQKFQEAGIEIPCIATSLQLARSGEAGQQQREAALPLLDLAADLGARGLRVFGGEPVRDNPTTSSSGSIAHEEAIAWAVDNLRTLAPEAQSRGVSLWFETHDYFRLGRDTAAVIRGVDHPSVRCNWDVMHPQVNGEDFSVTQTLLDGLVEHVHLHDAKDADANRICPFGEGVLPLVEMLSWLRGQNYSGYLSAEYFGDALGVGPDQSLPRWAEGCREILRQSGT